jgi:hypothetical protein
MDRPPHFDQLFPPALGLVHDPPQISSGDPDRPIERQAGWAIKGDLGISPLAHRMDMRRGAIVHEYHEAEPTGTVNRYHNK